MSTDSSDRTVCLTWYTAILKSSEGHTAKILYRCIIHDFSYVQFLSTSGIHLYLADIHMCRCYRDPLFKWILQKLNIEVVCIRVNRIIMNNG